MARKLTAKAVEAAKPAQSRREIPDGLVAGLYLVVQPSGAKSWAVRYRSPTGRPRKLTLGRYPAIELPGARERAKAALEAAEAGHDPGQAKATERAAKVDTFEAVAAAFVEKHCKRFNRTWPDQEALLRAHAVPTWRDRPISTIIRREVLELVEGIHDRGAPYAANRTLATIRKLFAWCVERDMLTANPAEGVKPPGKEQTRDRVLQDYEISALWAAFDEMGGTFGPLLKLLLLTAQRRTEVATMRWADLDLRAAAWTIPAADAKNGRSHVVPLAAPAVKVIQSVPVIDGSPYVFPGRGDKHKPVNGWGRPKDRAIALSGVDGWRLHDLRRTAASGMARLNVPPHVVEKVLNHSSGTIAGVAAVYNRHSYGDEKRHALETWAAHVMGVIEDQSVGSNVVSMEAGRARA